MKSKYSGLKWCLVHIGNDITYGLAFVAGELLRMNHKIMWLDGDDNIEILNKKKLKSGIYNVGYGKAISVKSLINLIDLFSNTIEYKYSMLNSFLQVLLLNLFYFHLLLCHQISH